MGDDGNSVAQVRLKGAGIVFGCVPDIRDPETESQLARICQALATRVSLPVAPYLAASPAELAAAFGVGDVTVLWASPTLLLTAKELSRAVPLVCSVRQGLTAYHGCVYVPQDSPVRSPVELRGVRAAWVAPTSAAGFIFPRLTLAGYGLEPHVLFASESFYGSHGKAADAVLSGQADVGAGYAVFENGNPTARLVRAPFLGHAQGTARILLTTNPIPSDLIVAAHSLSTSVRNELAHALQALERDDVTARALDHVLGVEGFRPHSPALLAALREEIEVGRRLDLLEGV